MKTPEYATYKEKTYLKHTGDKKHRETSLSFLTWATTAADTCLVSFLCNPSFLSLPSFLPSFLLPSFLRAHLPSFLSFLPSYHSFLSFLPSYHSFLPSYHSFLPIIPSFLPIIPYFLPSFLPSFLPCLLACLLPALFLPSFISPCLLSVLPCLPAFLPSPRQPIIIGRILQRRQLRTFCLLLGVSFASAFVHSAWYAGRLWKTEQLLSICSETCWERTSTLQRTYGHLSSTRCVPLLRSSQRSTFGLMFWPMSMVNWTGCAAIRRNYDGLSATWTPPLQAESGSRQRGGFPQGFGVLHHKSCYPSARARGLLCVETKMFRELWFLEARVYTSTVRYLQCASMCHFCSQQMGSGHMNLKRHYIFQTAVFADGDIL